MMMIKTEALNLPSDNSEYRAIDGLPQIPYVHDTTQLSLLRFDYELPQCISLVTFSLSAVPVLTEVVFKLQHCKVIEHSQRISFEDQLIT